MLMSLGMSWALLPLGLNRWVVCIRPNIVSPRLGRLYLRARPWMTPGASVCSHGLSVLTALAKKAAAEPTRLVCMVNPSGLIASIPAWPPLLSRISDATWIFMTICFAAANVSGSVFHATSAGRRHTSGIRRVEPFSICLPLGGEDSWEDEFACCRACIVCLCGGCGCERSLL